MPAGEERSYRGAFHFAPVFRVGRTLYVSGHVRRASEPKAQMREAFQGVQSTLEAAGAGWDDVVEIRPSSRSGTSSFGNPAWTAVGVTELYSPRSIVEIAVVAVIPDRGQT